MLRDSVIARPKGSRATWPIRVAAFEGAPAAIPPEAARAWDGRVSWSVFAGRSGRRAKKARAEGSWAEFANGFVAYASRVVEKGKGSALCQPSRDGRRLATSCAGVHVLHLDCEHAGDWLRFRAALDAAGLSYVLGRSASHTPEAPRWHAHVPLATPVRCSPLGWRVRYAHVIGALEATAGFRGPRFGGPRGEGFDAAVDNVMQPSFPGARRSPESPAPEVIVSDTGRALDLAAFLSATGFDLDRARRLVERTETAGGTRTLSGLAHEPDGRELPALARAFKLAGWLGAWRRNAWRARCPFFATHTGGRGADDAVIFAAGNWWCAHHSCARRSRAEIVAALPADARELYHALQNSAGYARVVAELDARPAVERVPLASVSGIIRAAIDEFLRAADAERAA